MNTAQKETTSDTFVSYLTRLQETAESGYNQYTHDTCILPHDAIYLYRVQKVAEFGNLIDYLIEKSSMDLPTIMTKLKPAREKLAGEFGIIMKQIDLLMENFGN